MSDEPRTPDPSDPAGTQPRVDRDALLPARRALWSGAPPHEPPGEAVVPAEFPDDDGPGGAVAAPRKLKYHEAPHAPKFQFLLGALLAIGAIAIASLVLLVGGSGDDRASGWSAWSPSSEGKDGAQEIADHVQPKYRLSTGDAMALVQVEQPEIMDYELDLVVRERPEEGGEIERLEGDTIYYRVCGLGPECALEGKPSISRGLLVQREALEIALYSFRYLRGVDHVVLYMPPKMAQVPDGERKTTRSVPLLNQIVHYSREELEPFLEAPLASTLAPSTPRVSGYVEQPEARRVEALSRAGQFSFSLVKGSADDEVFVVLEKLTEDEIIERQQAAQAEAAAAAMGGATGSTGAGAGAGAAAGASGGG